MKLKKTHWMRRWVQTFGLYCIFYWCDNAPNPLLMGQALAPPVPIMRNKCQSRSNLWIFRGTRCVNVMMQCAFKNYYIIVGGSVNAVQPNILLSGLWEHEGETWKDRAKMRQTVPKICVFQQEIVGTVMIYCHSVLHYFWFRFWISAAALLGPVKIN